MNEETKAHIKARLKELQPIAQGMAKDASLLTFPITIDGTVYKAVYNKKMEKFEYVLVSGERIEL